MTKFKTLSKHIMKQTAILLGATGLTGGIVLDLLLDHPDYSKVIVIGRSSVHKTHPKLEEHLIDMFQLEEAQPYFQGDVVFCCIGTTKSSTPDKETYKKIDYGIPVQAAQLAKANDIDCFVVISALGANPESNIFYNQVKGEMERDVLQQQIKHTYIVQPSLIGGNRDEKRMGERMAQWFMGTFSFLIPKKYKMISPETLAKAMLQLAKNGYGSQRVENHELKELITHES